MGWWTGVMWRWWRIGPCNWIGEKHHENQIIQSIIVPAVWLVGFPRDWLYPRDSFAVAIVIPSGRYFCGCQRESTRGLPTGMESGVAQCQNRGDRRRGSSGVQAAAEL